MSVRQRVRDKDQSVRLIVCGGGTGGHVFPALTTIRALRTLLAQQGLELDVHYLGTANGLEAQVAQREGIAFIAIPAGKLRRARNPLKMITLKNVRDLMRVPWGVIRAIRIMRAFRPDVVLSTGGYASVPAGLAAGFCRRPLIIHEQTTCFGLANRILARVATRVALSSPASMKLLSPRLRKRAVVTGNPIRPEVLDGNPAAAREALEWSGWVSGLSTVYITGGAQGSTQINTLVSAILPWLLSKANVIHQCGAQSLTEMRQLADTLPDDLRTRYRLMDFVGDELPDVFALADVIVSRSGAGTLAELTALGKPSILIPLIPTGGNEQVNNARHLVDVGAARALIESEATPENLLRELEPLLTNTAHRAQMAAAAATQGHPNAAQQLAHEVLTLSPRFRAQP